jgi:hypothetical protein
MMTMMKLPAFTMGRRQPWYVWVMWAAVLLALSRRVWDMCDHMAMVGDILSVGDTSTDRSLAQRYVHHMRRAGGGMLVPYPRCVTQHSFILSFSLSEKGGRRHACPLVNSQHATFIHPLFLSP